MKSLGTGSGVKQVYSDLLANIPSDAPNGTFFQPIDYVGDEYKRIAGQWVQVSSGGAGHNVDDILGVPREWVTPEVSGSPQSKQEFGDGTNMLRYFRVTYEVDGNGDDYVAGGRLKHGYPGIKQFNPGETVPVRGDLAITTVYIIAIGDAVSSSLVPGAIVTEAATEAQFRAAMQKFEFSSLKDVRTAFIESSERYSASAAPATTANSSHVQVRGASHA